MSLSRSGVFTLPSLPDRWKHGAVPVIGLTGAIGAGKSQVASLLAERGAVVIDADVVGHEVLEQPEIRRRIIERFGTAVVVGGSEPAVASGSVNRRVLASIVFASRYDLDDLEAIVHPPMRRQFQAIIDREQSRGLAPAVVLDAAILLEAGWDNLCDLVVFVAASQAVRLARVASRRGWTAEVLKAREAAQWPLERKLDRADTVIHNESNLESLDQCVDRLFRLITGRDPTSPLPAGAPVASRRSGSVAGLSPAMTLDSGGP